MADRKQVNLVVAKSQKEDWEEYVNESDECNSLSHLIRLAVSREISEEEQSPTAEQPSVDVSEFETQLDVIEARLDELSTDVQILIEGEETENLQELAGEIYDLLPEVKDEDEWLAHVDQQWEKKEESSKGGDTMHEFDIYASYLSVTDIADRLDVTEYRARKALARVEDSFSRVKEHRHDGQTYVYEVVPNGE